MPQKLGLKLSSIAKQHIQDVISQRYDVCLEA